MQNNSASVNVDISCLGYGDMLRENWTARNLWPLIGQFTLFDAHVRGSPSEYCHNVSTFGIEKKTRMFLWLPVGEKCLRICLLTSTQYTNVIDTGQTDGRTDGHRTTSQAALATFLGCSRAAESRVNHWREALLKLGFIASRLSVGWGFRGAVGTERWGIGILMSLLGEGSTKFWMCWACWFSDC